MDPNIERSEDTSSDFAPPHDYNIAQAFPVTDELVRKIARNHRRQCISKLAHSQPLRCAAVALLAITVVGFAFRR